MDISQMLDHLSEVSVFGHSALALFLILGIDFAITLLHTLQEWKGSGGPLWRNFGAIVGVWVPGWLGFPIFFLFLTAALWLVGLVGITGSLPTGAVQTQWAAAALGALVLLFGITVTYFMQDPQAAGARALAFSLFIRTARSCRVKAHSNGAANLS